jgi:hypothetical protein
MRRAIGARTVIIPNSGHWLSLSECPLSSKSGHCLLYSITSSARSSSVGGTVRWCILLIKKNPEEAYSFGVRLPQLRPLKPGRQGYRGTGRSPSFGLSVLFLPCGLHWAVTGVTEKLDLTTGFGQQQELKLGWHVAVGRHVAVDFEADAHFDKCRS